MLYEEYIKEALIQTINIYGPDAIGHIEEFKEFFENATLLSAIKGHRMYFTSAGEMLTSNIYQALIGSGINKNGKLPIGKCYISEELEDDNIQNIIEKKLDSSMQNLIDRMKAINEYIAENPKSDPNAFEMVDVISTYNNLVAFGKNPPESIKQDIDKMFFHRKQNFIENGIGTDSVAYKICEFCYNKDNLNKYPLPAVTIAAMRKIASLDLYSRQQERDGGQLFDNVTEVEAVKNYFNASNVVNPGFLEQFKGDLENIYNMAKDNKERNNEREKD